MPPHFHRDAHRAGTDLVETIARPDKGVDSGGRGVLRNAVRIAVPRERTARLLGHVGGGDEFRRVRLAAHEDLGARRAAQLAAFLHRGLEDTLDVLAGAESALQEVRTVARVDRLVQGPQLDAIGRRAAVGRGMRDLVDSESVDDIDGLHLHRLDARAFPALLALLGVRRRPALELQLRARSACLRGNP